ncbi:glucose-6-phosphate exchanger SLC37A2 isoform X1 [Leptopilina heterotoma]|uniref:glucose-6-phosphate exchanger SLC37A2 isoform X1 n=1 Tax=Leptopilina heterotoma TaxID=63436 RepID=UPI001CA9A272|nr:glucose-6-phosphate exchanger SLC37A2 isoform X1 [Leptopilina heterotoma]XP_043472890.1 glucose-6-phosphate exchanger SLC37A2 isoform X1 [Leptopilina heterotoma]
MSRTKDVPFGAHIVSKITSRCCPCHQSTRLLWNQGAVLVLTFLSYMCYHLNRKPISVVKNVLTVNCSNLSPPPNFPVNSSNRDTWCDWAPFDTHDSSALLGTLDSAFLFAYAGAMFLSGFIAERVNLRYFLALGMLTSGIASYLFGIARSYNIHSLSYLILVQTFGGICQTTGWPGVVTVVGNWFGRGNRGLIFGIWNSHTSLGNILGTLIAAYYVQSDWGLSFIVPGAIMGICGFLIFLFLVPHPENVGYSTPGPLGYRKIETPGSSDESSGGDEETRNIDENVAYRRGWHQHSDFHEVENLRTETSPMLCINRHAKNDIPIGFLGAINIPGVLEYSFSLFFAKLVSYTFLYWLPLYIAASSTYNAKESANISTVFDIGGVFGAIAAGMLSDYSGMSALTCAVMLALAVPTLFIYDYLGTVSFGVNVLLLLTAGFLVNGPYALITTAVSAELGTHSSLGNNAKALATVTSIIDGTGSVGAAIGPLLAGLVSSYYGWHNVFYMLMAADVLALFLLSRLVYRDIKMLVQRRWSV